MHIMMFTNTFTPHVGGVARGVHGLAEGLLSSRADVQMLEYPMKREAANGHKRSLLGWV